MSRKRSKEPRKQFRVGTGPEADFHPAEIEALALKIAQWYRSPESRRKYDDPVQVAKDHIKQCLLAEDEKGLAWKRCPHDFNTRIRVRCLYDIETETGFAPTQRRGERKVDKAAQAAAKAVMATANPVSASFDRDKFELDMVRSILKEYPELDNPIHRPNIERLAMVYGEIAYMKELLKLSGDRVSKRLEIIDAIGKLEKSAETTMKLLDIHPDSLRKNIQKRREGTLGELVTVLEGDEEFPERERIWSDALLLHLWWMANHPNGKKDGPQVTNWEIWHLTRSIPFSFTCQCGKHYPALLRGFEPEELRDLLIEKGIIVEEPILPIVPKEALEGIGEPWTYDGEFHLGGADGESGTGGLDA